MCANRNESVFQPTALLDYCVWPHCISEAARLLHSCPVFDPISWPRLHNIPYIQGLHFIAWHISLLLLFWCWRWLRCWWE